MNCKLKLLLDKSVVLVEYPGQEPQLFMPFMLQTNDIVFQNIIFDYESSKTEPELLELLPAHSEMVFKNASSSSSSCSSSNASLSCSSSIKCIAPRSSCCSQVVPPVPAPTATNSKLAMAYVLPGVQIRRRIPSNNVSASYDAMRKVFYTTANQS